MEGLKVADITIRRGGRSIVDGAQFSAPAGKVTGLVGPNGAGKSTLISAIVGIERPEAGALTFEGADLVAMGRRERAGICAYVEQSASTEERLSVADVVALGRIPHVLAWLSGLGSDDEAVVAGALERVGMSGFATRQFNTLSGGEQQRVHIARALAQQPKLLVLDEPTSHLDIRAQLQVLHLLGDLAGAGGTVLLALHDLNLALRFCDWLVVLDAGQVVAEGRPPEVLREDLLARVYGVHARLIEGPSGPVIAYEGTV
ncbi:ABC transporter ATP-binding protein [Devosia sp.]|uniref:ABC transporter ATP-binding protein n=1 Tax=Devosia sp. TaxID=1871048 RepID=UPI0025F6AB59|nr:ABC transporter ATP-binding protein [Devosia sp.]MCR6633385.1 ABC transporter ATP-binding protein [Devosia sp.]